MLLCKYPEKEGVFQVKIPCHAELVSASVFTLLEFRKE